MIQGNNHQEKKSGFANCCQGRESLVKGLLGVKEIFSFLGFGVLCKSIWYERLRYNGSNLWSMGKHRRGETLLQLDCHCSWQKVKEGEAFFFTPKADPGWVFPPSISRAVLHSLFPALQTIFPSISLFSVALPALAACTESTLCIIYLFPNEEMESWLQLMALN